MKREYTVKVRFIIRLFAVLVVVAGMLVHSMCAFAEDPVPFEAMMQSAGAPPAVPAKPDASAAASQPANAGKITAVGKTEIIGGYFLLGTGVLTIALTAAINSGFKISGPKVPALYVGGAAAAGVGVTLVVLGFHRRSKK
jgi:hypothetical protein